MEIYITAILKVKPEYLEEVITKLKEVAVKSRQEEANVQYKLHQSIEDTNTVTLYEVWKDEEGVAQHNKQTYFKELVTLFETRLQDPPIIISANTL